LCVVSAPILRNKLRKNNPAKGRESLDFPSLFEYYRFTHLTLQIGLRSL
jgi:hypothetical protein